MFALQLGMENGKPLGFAVAEYETAKQAEVTQQSCNGLVMDGCRIRITYCPPGMCGPHAMDTQLAAIGVRYWVDR